MILVEITSHKSNICTVNFSHSWCQSNAFSFCMLFLKCSHPLFSCTKIRLTAYLVSSKNSSFRFRNRSCRSDKVALYISEYFNISSFKQNVIYLTSLELFWSLGTDMSDEEFYLNFTNLLVNCLTPLTQIPSPFVAVWKNPDILRKLIGMQYWVLNANISLKPLA